MVQGLLKRRFSHALAALLCAGLLFGGGVGTAAGATDDVLGGAGGGTVDVSDLHGDGGDMILDADGASVFEVTLGGNPAGKRWNDLNVLADASERVELIIGSSVSALMEFSGGANITGSTDETAKLTVSADVSFGGEVAITGGAATVGEGLLAVVSADAPITVTAGSFTVGDHAKIELGNGILDGAVSVVGEGATLEITHNDAKVIGNVTIGATGAGNEGTLTLSTHDFTVVGDLTLQNLDSPVTLTDQKLEANSINVYSGTLTLATDAELVIADAGGKLLVAGGATLALSNDAVVQGNVTIGATGA